MLSAVVNQLQLVVGIVQAGDSTNVINLENSLGFTAITSTSSMVSFM